MLADWAAWRDVGLAIENSSVAVPFATLAYIYLWKYKGLKIPNDIESAQNDQVHAAMTLYYGIEEVNRMEIIVDQMWAVPRLSMGLNV